MIITKMFKKRLLGLSIALSLTSLASTQIAGADTVNLINSLSGFGSVQDVGVNLQTGEVWVTDATANAVKRYNQDLTGVTTFSGPTGARGVSVSSLNGWVYVTGSSAINIYNNAGALQSSATGSVVSPQGIAVNPYTGQYYAANTGSSININRFAPSTSLETSWTPFSASPYGVAFNPNLGIVYASDPTGTGKISAFSASGTPLFSFGSGVSGSTYFLAIQNTTNQLLGYGLYNGKVSVYSSTGTLQYSFGSYGNSAGGVAINPGTGMIYVTDSSSNSLQRLFAPSEWTDSGTNVFANAHAGAYTPPANNVNTNPTVELGSGELNQRNGLKSGQQMQVTTKLTIDQLNALNIAGGAVSVGTTANYQANAMTVNSGGTLQLDAVGFYDLSKVVLNGGTITTSTPSTAGALLPSGTLNASGSMTLAVQSQLGSLINATGNLNMGVTSRLDGVALQGNLNTNQFTVTLNDANQAVLGQLTQVGTATLNGTLIGTNGLALPQFDTLQGRGVVQAGINSNIILDGFTQGVGGTLAIQTSGTGITKGIGTIGANVDLSGTTFSPGHSPGSSYFVGATSLTNMLAEIAGTTATSQYDQIWVGEPGNAAGSLTLTGGLLTVQLLSGFMPVAGDIFDIIKVLSGLGSPPNIMGAFGSFDFSLAVLNPGLFWNVIGYLANDGSGNEVYRLQVVASVPEPSTYLLLGSLLGLGFLLRRKIVRAA